MLKKLFVAAALLLPSLASGQVSFSFANYVSNGSGFTEQLIVRNANLYSDPTITYVNGPLYLDVGGAIGTFCFRTDVTCFLGVTTGFSTGVVQDKVFTLAGQMWYPNPSYSPVDCSVASSECLSRTLVGSNDLGILGCQVAARNAPSAYTLRTCAADGYTGGLGFNIFFNVNAPAGLAVPAFSGTDILASMTNTPIAGPNALLAPEPATVALFGVGLLVVGMVRRRWAA